VQNGKRALLQLLRSLQVSATTPLNEELTIDRRKLLAEQRDKKLLSSGIRDGSEDADGPDSLEGLL